MPKADSRIYDDLCSQNFDHYTMTIAPANGAGLFNLSEGPDVKDDEDASMNCDTSVEAFHKAFTVAQSTHLNFEAHSPIKDLYDC